MAGGAAAGRLATTLVAGGVQLDLISREADSGAGPVPLAEREFLLLRELMRHNGRTVPKQQLLSAVWDYNFDIENSVKHTRVTDEIRLGARVDGDRAVITVADSGGGMPAEVLGGIFERFARLDEGRSRDRAGAGLGLPIVRTIATAHGGSASCVRSSPGEGSVFQIVLPLDGQPAAVPATAAFDRVDPASPVAVEAGPVWAAPSMNGAGEPAGDPG